ncbi:GNAT family N-acetyltransferase [Hippea alviniae]|uniref:GNAT family N-acetyltransferase n=1 Tax=Hippea alviniae TaxID=1279027 RepID=UPI0003B6FE6E|nr:GNAT family N-acetyltransferase [Hippea alviniae]
MGKEKESVELKLELPGNDRFMGVFLSFIDEAMRAFGLEKDESLRIRLAAEETVRNVIEHGLNNNINESFLVILRNMPNRVEIIVKEKGLPFDFDNESKQKKNKKGLGILLIRSVMDEVYFKNLGRDGKETRLVKYKSSDDIRNFLTDKAVKKIEPKKVKYFIRDFKKEDALEVSKCAYFAYGYTYEPFIYYPSQIVRMNEERSLLSIVAETEDGDLAGHAALKFYNNNLHVGEMGVAFVKPEYRNNGISESMADYLINKAKTIDGLNALYLRLVTAHIYSQKPFFKRGFVPTGLLLGLFPKNVNFKDLTGEVEAKTTALLVSFYLKNADRRTIFLPNKHKDMIRKIVDELGIDYEIGKPKGLVDNGDEKIEYIKTDVFNSVDLYCKSYDKKSFNLIKKTLKKLLAQKVDVVYLYLDMENPYMPEVAKQCEEEGFFFAGILPFGIDGHHALIYQYMNTQVDFDSIVLYDDRAKEILDYIKPFATI